MRRITTLLVAALAFVLAAPALANNGKPSPKPPKTTSVQLLAFNDFHGNLQPPAGSGGRIQTGLNGTTAVNVDAGGVAYLATHLKTLRSTNTNSITVAAGD